MNFLTIAKIKKFLIKPKIYVGKKNQNSVEISYEILNYNKVLDKYIYDYKEKHKKMLDDNRQEICNDTTLSHCKKVELINKELDAYNELMDRFFQTVSFEEAEIAPEDYYEKDDWYEKLWSSVDAKELTSKLKKLKKRKQTI